MKIAHLVLLLVAAILVKEALAQTQATEPAKTRDYTIQCSLLSLPLPGCHSFNEMVQAKDTELLNALSSPENYVCFRNGDDIFSIINIGTPDELTFKKQDNGTYKAPGMVFYSRFKNGLNEERQFVIGNWTAISKDAPPFFSVDATEGQPSASISRSEISFSYSYKNASGGTTHHVIQTRRSTLRTTETLQWQSPGKDAKSPPERGGVEVEGRCTVIK